MQKEIKNFREKAGKMYIKAKEDPTNESPHRRKRINRKNPKELTPKLLKLINN